MDSPSPKSGTKMHTVLTGTKFPERVFSTKDMIGVFSAEPQLPIYVSKCKVMVCPGDRGCMKNNKQAKKSR